MVLLARGTNNVDYTVRVSPQTQITRRGGIRAVVTDLNVGDRLQITGQLDPTQAGYLIAASVADDSVVSLANVRGTVNYINDARNLVTVDWWPVRLRWSSCWTATLYRAAKRQAWQDRQPAPRHPLW